ncbi:hypothetical protein FQN54_000702 [Arachnomyces sp. PD_36]|nr:hypothetical protein FQN54_000702 [Arachnomyces sp. PD_36]
MGWFDGTSSVGSSRHHHHDSSRSHGHGHSRSYHKSHHSRSSAPSFFNLGGSSSHHGGNRSTTSIFSSSSSSRRARPRSGFISRLIHKIRRLLRDIYHYARRHPMKVFMLVIMPLITGGILQKLLSVVGVRLPKGLAGGSDGGRRGGDSSSGMEDGVKSLMTLAKMFM